MSVVCRYVWGALSDDEIRSLMHCKAPHKINDWNNSNISIMAGTALRTLTWQQPGVVQCSNCMWLFFSLVITKLDWN